MKCRNIVIGILSLTLAVSSVTFPLSASSAASQMTAAAADEEITLDPDMTYQNCGDHIEITAYNHIITYAESHSERAHLVIPETIEGLPVTKIAPGAFKGLYYLSSVELPMTMEEIGDSAFEGCFWLGGIHFSPMLRRIGKRAFSGCLGPGTLVLPDTVEEIGEEAFADCSTIHYVVLPDSLRTIRRGTFAGDDCMFSICLPSSIERIEKDAFAGCKKLQNVCYKGSADAWSVLSIGSGNESLTQNEFLCDYNKQKVERSLQFDPEKDSWGFLNKELEYYVLSDESLKEMDASIFVRNAGSHYWEKIQQNAYKGACLGFAATSLLAAAGILDPSELDPDATCLHDVKLTDEVREYITYYFTLQGDRDFMQGWIPDTELMYYYLEQNIPLLFTYGGFFTDEDGQRVGFGHAVVAYGIEEGRFEFDGNVFRKKILTYDSNVSEENGRDGNIYVDPENPYWKFDELNIDRSYVDMLISPELLIYVPYYEAHEEVTVMMQPPAEDLDLLNLRGKNKGVAYAEPEQKCAIFRTAVLPAEYKMQSFAPGSPQTRADAAYTQVKAGSYQALQCADGQKGYVLEMQDKQDLDCSMSYENWLYSVNGSDIASAAFEPDGAVSIRGENMEYELMMVADDQHPTSYYELHISGENADVVSVQQKQGGYVIAGTDLHDVTVEALNDSKALALSFSTDAQRVLVHETERNTLAVSADLDEDGFYETLLVSGIAPDLGDVNCDGSINAKDASEILIASSRAGTGQGTGLTEAQQKAADVDHDGSINSVDAAWILRYAAAFGTGAFTGSMEEFVGDGATS